MTTDSLRRAMAPIVVAAAAVAVAACSEPAAAPAPAVPPRGADVLLVVIDTLRADRCSFLDASRPTTPRLAAFAGECVTFTDAWAPSPWTLPSHASLFTGRGAAAFGLADGTADHLRDDVPVLAEILSGRGWATGCFTANPWISPATGLSRGFGTFEPLWTIAQRPAARDVLRAPSAWIRSRAGGEKPWFAFVNVTDPHAPWDPSPARAAQFLRPGTSAANVEIARRLCAPFTCVGDARARFGDGVVDAASDLYDGDVADADDAVGAFLDDLRASGALDRAIVVVCSDHGEGLGDHGWLEHATFLHRELLRVPLLVRPPGGTPARRVDDVVRLEDVLPTVLAACGVPVPAPCDGLPLLGDTSGRVATAIHAFRPEFAESLRQLDLGEPPERILRRRRSVRTGGLHLIEEGAGVQLFDVASDPGERHDLAKARPDDVARLRTLLPGAAGDSTAGRLPGPR